MTATYSQLIGLIQPGKAGRAAPVSKAMAEGYLHAIQKQCQLVLEEDSDVDPIYFGLGDPGSAISQRETQLLDAGGSSIFSSEIQDLIRQLIRLRKTVDPNDSHTIFLDPTVWIHARREHNRVRDELANALGNFIEEEGVDGFEVARGLVRQFFGVKSAVKFRESTM
jgi:hypothetical protein